MNEIKDEKDGREDGSCAALRRTLNDEKGNEENSGSSRMTVGDNELRDAIRYSAQVNRLITYTIAAVTIGLIAYGSCRFYSSIADKLPTFKTEGVRK